MIGRMFILAAVIGALIYAASLLPGILNALNNASGALK